MKSLTTLLIALALSFNVTSCGPGDHDHADHEPHDEDAAQHEDGDAHAGAGEGHGEKEGGDDHAAKAGPNGGRLIMSVEPHLEFLVTDDRKVKITAVDEDDNLVPLGDQNITVIAGDRTNPTRLAFAKSGKFLVSDNALPEGNDFPLVISIKGAGADPVLEKFNLNLSDCPTCDYKEYACICDHDEDEDHAHEKE